MSSKVSSLLPLALAPIAIGMGLAAQHLVQAQHESPTGWALFGMAGILMGAAARGRGLLPPATVSPVASVGRWRFVTFAAAAVLLVGAATTLSLNDQAPVVALLIWLGGLLAASLALWEGVASPPARRAPSWSAAEAAAMAAILALAAAARTLWIAEVPPYYFGDEPRVGVYVLQHFSAGAVPNFFNLGWNTWPTLGLSLQGIFAPFLGIDTTSLRLASSLFGTLAVLFTYLLARQLFGPRMAILSGVLLAVGRTSLDFSRMGICHSQVMMFESAAFYFWWRGINGGRARHYLFTGFALGLCYYTYNAGQLALPLWLAWVALCAVGAPSTVRSHWRAVLVTLAGFLLLTFPLMMYVTDSFHFGRHWFEWTYMSRNRQVMSQVLEAWSAGGLGAAARVLGGQVWLTWLGFGVIPGDAYHLGYRGGGMLDQVSAALFVVGLIGASMRLIRPRYAFLLLWWLLTTLVGGVLTVAPPAFVRLVGLLPDVAIIAALPLAWLLCAGSARAWSRWATGALVLALLGAAAWLNYDTYFVRFPREEFDFMSELAHAVRRFPPTARVRMMGLEHYLHFSRDELFQLDFPRRDLQDVDEVAHLLPIHTPTDTPLGLILGPTQLTLADYVHQLYPAAVLAEVSPGPEHQLIMRTVAISADALRQRAGLRLAGTTEDAGAAMDPFGAGAPAGRPLQWRGQIYWPTSRPARLEIESDHPLHLELGGQTVTMDAAGTTAASLQLPRGWLPVAIDEPAATPTRRLSIRIIDTTGVRLLSRWDFRPDTVWHGLRAEYDDGHTVSAAIEPMLDLYSVETFFEPQTMPVHAPFVFHAAGALLVDTSGTYGLEVHTTGPFDLSLDGVALLSATEVNPEEMITRKVERELTAGAHRIEVHYDGRRLANTTRRVFQLFWTPPGGEAARLVPPPHFSPTDAVP